MNAAVAPPDPDGDARSPYLTRVAGHGTRTRQAPGADDRASARGSSLEVPVVTGDAVHPEGPDARDGHMISDPQETVSESHDVHR